MKQLGSKNKLAISPDMFVQLCPAPAPRNVGHSRTLSVISEYLVNTEDTCKTKDIPCFAGASTAPSAVIETATRGLGNR